MTARLKQVAIKHSHVSRNIKTHEIKSINNIDNTLTPGSDCSPWKLVIDIKAQDGERFAIAIARNWKIKLELWVKKKQKVQE